MAAPAPAPPAPAPRTGVVIGALLLVMLLAALDQTIVATALPTIVGDLGGINHISWVVTAYLLAQTVVTPLYGKLGDLYGRKLILQVAVVVFLAGSILCGVSQDLLQLIVFRAIQGLGGGGLMVGAQAAIGDLVAPRERGRYNGLFGAVFGAASVGGPLLGGFLTSSLSWRWIFYINIPLGAVALIVLAAALPAPAARASHAIDYLGTVVLAAGLSALVLLTTLGGAELGWTSAPILGLAVAAVALLVAFGFLERRAREPVLAPWLFRNRVFLTTSAVGFVVGFAMFGAITYLPLFQQVVKGLSPTASGLQLLPLMGGLLAASIGSGMVITRTGRYRSFPIAGTAIAAVGLLLLSRLTQDTTDLVMGLYMAILGVGLGLVMQVLVLAVQNAVPYEDLGVATSGATLFRSIGGSLGTAILGAVFAGRLSSQLADSLPPGAEGVGASTTDLSRLAAPVRDAYLDAYTDSLSSVFLIAAVIAVLAFALTWLITEVPLRETVATAGVGEAFAIPREPSSLREMTRALDVLIGRAGMRAVIAASAAGAGVDLSPTACWLLVRLRHDPALGIGALARAGGLEWSALEAARSELVARGDLDDDAGRGRRLTPAGLEAVDLLVGAYRERLAAMLEGWSPERHAELRALCERFAREAAPRPAGAATAST